MEPARISKAGRVSCAAVPTPSHRSTVPAAWEMPVPKSAPGVGVLALLFFVSGAAALIYQVVWQRILLAAFGVDIETVTVVVSVFMFGIGGGALVGGRLAERFPGRALMLFAGC